MRQRRLISGTLGALSILILGSNNAHADPILGHFGAEAHVFAQAITRDIWTAVNNSDNDPFLLTAAAEASTGLGNGTASASASAAYSSVLDAFGLHAFAQADVFVIPPITDRASATASAQWADTLRITSGTLPEHTPISLQFTMDVHAAFTVRSCPTGEAGGANAGGSLRFTSTSGLTDVHLTQNLFACEDGSRTATGIVNTFVGDTLALKAILGAGAGSQGGLFAADASNTMLFFIDTLSPDVSYTTASGYSYRTPLTEHPAPVPEPASGLLLTMGGIGLSVHRRWSKRRGFNASREQ